MAKEKNIRTDFQIGDWRKKRCTAMLFLKAFGF